MSHESRSPPPKSLALFFPAISFHSFFSHLFCPAEIPILDPEKLEQNHSKTQIRHQNLIYFPQHPPIPMRIRGSTPTASSAVVAPSPTTPPPSTSSSSSSSCFSSSTHSTISTHSLTSSSNSASCSQYTAADSPSKCEGLDLLVKAVYYVVAGSVVGVPYIQRRVIRRRKRASCYSNLIVGGSLNSEVKLEDGDQEMEGGKRKRRKNMSGMPWKLQDSVVYQSWKPPTPPVEKPASSSRSRRRGSAAKNGKGGSGIGI